MILHIFKKDVRILRAFILGAALIDLTDALLHLRIESVQFQRDLEVLNIFIIAADFIALLFGFALITMVVQLDPIPGERQDWLARPIPRLDLLVAKLLFVVLFVHAPLLAADTLHGLAAGFPLGQTLAAAGARNLYLFGLMTLPVMALAAMTGSVKKTLGLGLAVAVGALAVTGGILGLYFLLKVTSDSGHTMTSFVLQMAVLLAGATAIIILQYFKRATVLSRLVLGLAAVLALGTRLLLPQDAAYAMENRFLPGPGQGVSLSFAPGAGKLRAAGSGTVAAGPGNLTDSGRLVALPLAVAGLPPQLMLVGAEMRAILTAPDGNSVELQAQNFPLQTPAQQGNLYYQTLRVPVDFFDAHQGQPMRVELDYSLAIVRPQGVYKIAAAGGELRIPRLGRCATSMSPVGLGVILRCKQAGEERMRVNVALTDDAKGLSNPELSFHWPSDAPYRNGDAMITRFGHVLPFGIAGVDARYPVGAAQIPEATVRLSVSEPLTWIERRITIADVRLDAWMANNE